MSKAEATLQQLPQVVRSFGVHAREWGCSVREDQGGLRLIVEGSDSIKGGRVSVGVVDFGIGDIPIGESFRISHYGQFIAYDPEILNNGFIGEDCGACLIVAMCARQLGKDLVKGDTPLSRVHLGEGTIVLESNTAECILIEDTTPQEWREEQKRRAQELSESEELYRRSALGGTQGVSSRGI